MKAVLMAAGVGNRIRRHVKEKPKCTVELATGQKLVDYTVSLLLSKGVADVTVVTGYRAPMVRDALCAHPVRYFHNPFYRVTNSIASLWFAREVLTDDDVVLMNADTFLEERIVDDLLGSHESPTMLVDTSRAFDEMDYKFSYEQGILRGYGKDLSEVETDGEYVGVAKLMLKDLSRFRDHLELMIDQHKSDKWWEDVLYELSGDGLDVLVSDVAGTFWAEVDYFEDYLRIQEYLGAKERAERSAADRPGQPATNTAWLSAHNPQSA